MKPREANIEVRGEQGAQDGTPSVHVRFKMYSMQTYLATLGIDYDALTKDEFISLWKCQEMCSRETPKI